MSITVVSIDGIDAQQAGWFSTTLQRNQIRGKTADRTNTFMTRARRSARYGGSSRAPRQITVLHKLEGTFEDSLQLLEGLFYPPYDPLDPPEPLEMVILEEGVEKFCHVVPVGLAEDSRNGGDDDCGEFGWWLGTWDLLSNEYLAVEETPQTATLMASPDTITATVAGTIPTHVVRAELTPNNSKDPADGMQARTYATIANRSPRPMINHPVNVGIIPATGYAGEGLELRAGGRRIMHWSQTNNPSEKLWASWELDLPAGRYWTVKIAATAGVTTLQIQEPLVNLDPAPFWIQADIGGGPEVLRVTAVDTIARTFTVERGQRNSTAATLTVGTKLWLVPAQGLLDIVFGQDPPEAVTYIDDQFKPVVALSTSTNDHWIFALYYEERVTGNTSERLQRGGALRLRTLGQYDREILRGDGDQYWRYIPGAISPQPATEFGLDYRSLGPISGRPLADRWDFESPIGIVSGEFDWNAVNIAYDETGSPIKTSRLAFYGIDGDGYEHLVARLDKDVTGGSGNQAFSFPVPVYCLSWRIEPWDPNTEAAGLGSALEPASGTAWRVTGLEVTFSSSETPLIHAATYQHTIYEFGRPDAPATIQTDLGTTQLQGIIVNVGDTLVLTTDDRVITSGPAPTTDLYRHGHLVQGPLPMLPADPPGGSTDITVTDVGQTSLMVELFHRDAWA